MVLLPLWPNLSALLLAPQTINTGYVVVSHNHPTSKALQLLLNTSPFSHHLVFNFPRSQRLLTFCLAPRLASMASSCFCCRFCFSALFFRWVDFSTWPLGSSLLVWEYDCHPTGKSQPFFSAKRCRRQKEHSFRMGPELSCTDGIFGNRCTQFLYTCVEEKIFSMARCLSFSTQVLNTRASSFLSSHSGWGLHKNRTQITEVRP